MSTTLAQLRQLLAAEIGDVIPVTGSCASTTTSDGTPGGSTIVDSALMSLPSDWIRTGTGGEPQTAILLTSGTYSGQVRFASTFLNTTGAVTVSNAFGGQVLSGVTYEIHRYAPPAQKEDCIAKACKEAFPSVYVEVDSEVFHFGDWLIDGHFEQWTTTTNPTYWTATTVTATQYASDTFGGTYACALSTANGYIAQGSTNNKDLLMLGGTTPTFSARVKASTANQVRLAIYDGTTFTYSSYHTGGGGWELLSVSATIKDNPSTLSLRIYLTGFLTTAYIDNAGLQAVSPKYNYDISSLNLVNDVPNAIYTVVGQEMDSETYYPLNDSALCNYWRPLGDGRIQFFRSYADGTKLRIVGRKYVTEPTSSVSTEPEAPQTYIISALAAKRLFSILSQTAASHSVEAYRDLESYWEKEAKKRRIQHGMRVMPITRTFNG